MGSSPDGLDALQHGMRGADGLIHGASQSTAHHAHAGWWESACGQNWRKREDRALRTEAPTNCLVCLGSSKYRREG